MGLSTGIYFGAFIKCRVSETEIIKTIKTCSNQDCDCFKKVIGDSIFYCNQCGSIIKERKDMGKSPQNYFYIAEKINEVLFVPNPAFENNYHYWIPNTNNVGYHVNTTYVDYTVKNLNDFNVEEEIKSIKNHCREAIEVLNEEYGAENISFDVGLLTWRW